MTTPHFTSHLLSLSYSPLPQVQLDLEAVPDSELWAQCEGLAGLITLDNMTVQQLQAECDYRELDTSGIRGKRKAAYLQLLREPMRLEYAEVCADGMCITTLLP